MKTAFINAKIVIKEQGDYLDGFAVLVGKLPK